MKRRCCFIPTRPPAAFIANTYIPHVFLNRSYRRSILDDNPIDGIMQTPQLSQITIQGPLNGLPANDTPGRRKILVCTPSNPSGELSCAKTILGALARKAYRRPLTDADTAALVSVYRTGRESGGFEDGIESGLQFILAHPEFVFRAESAPANVRPGEPYRMPVEIGIANGDRQQPAPRIERVEMNAKHNVFTIAADREPADVTFDPNTWLLMDQISFGKRSAE